MLSRQNPSSSSDLRDEVRDSDACTFHRRTVDRRSGAILVTNSACVFTRSFRIAERTALVTVERLMPKRCAIV